MGNLSVTVAVGAYDRVGALTAGRLRIEGCDATYFEIEPEEIFHRALRGAEFDIAELPFSSYLLASAAGTCPYIAIPVFPSRAFRHSALYIRADRRIETAADLRGKMIGVPVYAQTAGVWVRGMLEDEYGVSARDIDWVAGGLESHGRRPTVDFTPPAWLRIAALPEGRSLSEALARGDLDAVISARPPSCFLRGDPAVKRLFPDYKRAEQDYYARTKLFPIMHVLGIRSRLAEDHPWLASSVLKAFARAKDEAIEGLHEVTALKMTAPWCSFDIGEVEALMGKDYWPYGFAENRTCLESMSRWFASQGLLAKPVAIEAMFHPATLERIKI